MPSLIEAEYTFPARRSCVPPLCEPISRSASPGNTEVTPACVTTLPSCVQVTPLVLVSKMASLPPAPLRSEEHTSELQSLMRISYAVFCLKKKKQNNSNHKERSTTEENTEKLMKYHMLIKTT